MHLAIFNGSNTNILFRYVKNSYHSVLLKLTAERSITKEKKGVYTTASFLSSLHEVLLGTDIYDMFNQILLHFTINDITHLLSVELLHTVQIELNSQAQKQK